MPKKPNNRTQKSKSNKGEVNSSPTTKRLMVTANNETAADVFKRLVANDPQFVEIKSTGRGYEFFGEHIYQQAKAAAVKAMATSLRPGDRVVLARVFRALVHGLAEVNAIVQDTIEVALVDRLGAAPSRFNKDSA